jgi:hypothetical protein
VSWWNDRHARGSLATCASAAQPHMAMPRWERAAWPGPGLPVLRVSVGR